ncbi:MAG: hypothetical protein N2442_05160 [Spirochaetes bacterium]|nr:hypothetical protein [Spirochaetota bacterium]
MSSVQKLFLSLLLTIIAFTGFVFAAYFGLFEYLETHFYNVKVQETIQRTLERTGEHVSQYLRIHTEKYKSIMEMDFIKTIYFLNQSREHIFNRESLFGKLAAEQTGFSGVRFVDLNIERIHFSTFPEDVLRKTGTNIELRNLKDVETGTFLETLKKKAAEEPIILHPGANSFIYCFKAFDIYAKHAGYALFYVGKLGLQNYLLKNGDLSLGDTIEFVDGVGIVLKAQYLTSQILESLQKYWMGSSSEVPYFVLENGEAFRFFESKPTTFLKIGLFQPASLFGLSTTLKGIIFVCTFITLFLLFFLIFNLKQEPVLVVSERIKKLQLHLLWEYLERNQEIDWKKIQLELESRREEVKSEILKGVGRVKKEDKTTLESLFDKSWDEILTVIGNKAQATSPAVDLNRLTELIERALQKITVTQAPIPTEQQEEVKISKAAGRTIPSTVPQMEKVGEGKELKESEEVEELEEVESVEEAEEAVPLEEVRELEEAEELEEAAEEVVEIEEAIEVEDISEAEEVEEVEAVEEVEEAEEVEAASRGEGVKEVEELEEIEEAELIEELEKLEEIEAVEEVSTPSEVEEPEEVETLPAVEALEIRPGMSMETREMGVAVDQIAEIEKVEEAKEAEEVELLEEAEDWGILEELQEGDTEVFAKPSEKTFPSRREILLTKHLFGGASIPRLTGKRTLSGTVSLVNLYEEGYFEYLELGASTTLDEEKTEQQDQVIVTKPDGIIQIDERTFSTEWVPKDQTLKGLVDQVVKGAEREQTYSGSEEKGIEDLFEGIEVSLEDIFGEIPKEEESLQKEHTEGALTQVNPIVEPYITEDGYFLLNQYFRNYKRDETGIHKALVRLSQIFSSPICQVLRKNESMYSVIYSVGFPQTVIQGFQLEDGPYFARMFRNYGSILRIRYPFSLIEEFCVDPSVKNIVKDLVPLCIPYIDGGEKGIVLLATKIGISLEELRALFLAPKIMEVANHKG